MKEAKGEDNVLIEFGRRMREIRDHLKISQTGFAKKLGVSNSFISEIEYGRTKPGLKLFIKLADTFKVNPTWLLLGKGKMFLSDSEGNSGNEGGNLSDSEKSVRKMLWYMNHSPLVKYSVIGFTLKFLHDNEAIIKKDIDVNKSLHDTE